MEPVRRKSTIMMIPNRNEWTMLANPCDQCINPKTADERRTRMTVLRV